MLLVADITPILTVIGDLMYMYERSDSKLILKKGNILFFQNCLKLLHYYASYVSNFKLSKLRL